MDSNILFIQLVNRKIVVQTRSEFIKKNMSSQLEFILQQYGYERLSNNTFVNMNMIKHISDDETRVYFDDEKKISCPLTRRNKYKVRRYFDKI